MNYDDKTYKQHLTDAMEWLSNQPNTIFVGQGLEYGGIFMCDTFQNIDKTKCLEVPVFEDTQLGMSLGLAIAGYSVLTLFPRHNFLACAMDQLCNHLDKIKELCDYNVSVLIRLAVGTSKPIDPGCQHRDNHLDGLISMLDTIKIYDLRGKHQIIPAYQEAYNSKRVCLLNEYGDYYND